jgi:hypothetical protein
VAGWLSRTLDSQSDALDGMTPEAAVTGHPEQRA